MNFRSRKTTACSTIMKVTVLPAVLALLLVGSCSANSSAAPSFDVTRHFSLSANSTCGGDPPTLFEDQNAPGVLLNCTVGEYEARLALDGDSNTRWQSATGDTPVTLTFSLQQASLAIELVAVHLQLSTAPPELLLLEVQTRDGGGYTLAQVYTADPVSSCPEYTAQGIPCSAYENLTNVIVCPVNFSGPVSQFRFTASGFPSHLSASMRYMALNEATILGRVVDGFFVRSFHHISVEGEEGRNMDTREVVQTATDETQFPDFSFRGYAVLQFSSSQREMVQWMFPSLPAASRYQLVFRYGNSGTSRTLGVTIMQGSRMYNARLLLVGGCIPPCFAALTNASNVNQAAEFELSNGPLTVTMTLSSVNFVLDSITAIPEHFYAPTTLADGTRFTQNCGVSSGSLGQGTVDEAFCLESAIQLSAEFYSATYACDCPDGSVCEGYGGQCPCMAAADAFVNITGRQCNLCPFFNYLTPQGCTACGCSDPLDDCDVTTGQCPCRPLATGRTCDRCEVNTFGDPNLGCMPCSCNSTGTVGACNQTSGECTCKPGVMGPLCDQCMEGAYNFSLAGCAPCECDPVGSVSANCSDEGQCQCKPGVAGLKCSDCLPGFYFLSDAGCLPCDCSGRSSICQQDPISPPTIPSEQCSCPQPYMGDSCEGCVPGFFLSAATGDCESCQCNGRALTCTPGNGTCISCSNNTRGNRCELCQEGYYDADPSASLLCLPCPCNIVTALNTSCTPDASGSPVCYCRPGHEGSLCDLCSPGFFGQPPNFRCTQCDCNGNIDPSVPGSCDMSTGVCLLCINNTIGDECERCAPGFYGDATAQNCTPCACLPDGSDSSLCDSSTGQCSCLPGVNGQRCEQCMPGFWNFTAGVGCEPCVCGVGSANNECNMETGACTCMVGVGGSDCSFCLPGFFNFSNGCTACGCGIGVMNDSCSEEGECNCQPGVVGPKCDTCDTFHMTLTSAGCEPCGECEQLLRMQHQAARNTLNVTIQDTETFGMLLDTDMRGFSGVRAEMTEIASNISATRTYLNMLETRLADIGGTVSTSNNTAENISARVDVAMVRANLLISYANIVNNHVSQLYNRAQNAAMEVIQLNSSLAPVTATLQMQAAQAAAIESNLTTVASQYIGRNFSDHLERGRVILPQAESVNSDAQTYLLRAQIQRNQTISVAATLENISVSTDSVAMAINLTQQALDEVEESLQQASIICAQVASDVSTIEATVNFAITSLDSVEGTISRSHGGLILAQDDIRALSSLLGQEGGGSGLGVILGIGSGVGSGVEDEQSSTVPEAVTALRTAVEALRGRAEECAGVIMSAEQHATNLEVLAANISNILNASLDMQRPAVGVILNYTVAIDTINQALRLTSITNTTIRALLESVMVDQLWSASSLLATSELLLMRAREANNSVTRLLQDVSTARSQVMLAANRSEEVAQLALSLAAGVDQLRIAADMTIRDVSRLLSSTTRQQVIVNSTHAAISLVAMELLTNVTVSQTEVDNAQQMFNSADSALDSANLTALAALQATTQRSTILTDIEQNASANAEQLAALNASIDTLMAQLQEAMQAAASIDVALRFYGNSSFGYRVPAQATDDSTSISLVFQPSDVSSGVMLHTSEAGGESLALRLSNGSVQFEYDNGRLLSSPSRSVQRDRWYQLYATREGRMTLLSVSPLQGGFISTTMGSSLLSSFVLSTSDTLYLGGTPNTSVVSDGYEGCLDRVVVNNAQLSLSLPDERNEPLTFCGPRPPAETPRAFETGVWLQGNGSFIWLSPPSSPLVLQSSELRVQVAFRTFSPNGLLLQMFGVRDMMQNLSLSLSGGRVVMEFASSSLQNTMLESNGDYANGNWYLVTAELSERNVTLTINMTETVFTDALNLVVGFTFSDQIYVGGLPPDIQANIGSSLVSFAGCMHDLQVNGVLFDLQNTTSSNRALFGGCPAEVAAGVRFMGEGMASFCPIPAADERLSGVSFAFRSTQLAALLLNVDAQPAPLSVSLYHTWVRVDLGATSLLSSRSGLSDNQWHQVSVTLTAADNETNMTITVDNETVSTLLPSPPPTLTTDSLLVVGGINETSSVLVTERFRGCFDSLILNGRPVDFNGALQLDGVSLYGCRPLDVTTPLLPPPPPPLPPPPSIRPNVTIGLDGSSGSFIAYPITEAQVVNSFSILLEFQTVSSDAILLYAQDNWDFLALELRDGQLVYSYNLGSGRTSISSTNTYSDGLLHVVELRRTGRSGELVVDGGIETANGSSPGNFTALNIHSTMLFVGGTPTTMPPTSLVGPNSTSIPPSALACFHALAINNRYIDLSMPQATMGAEECRDTYTNIASFNGTGYIQLVDSFYAGIRFTFSMDIRTTQCTGLLAYVATPLYPDHVLLEIVNGTVRFLFDNGPRAVVVEYVGSRVCDGQWHSLRVEKEALTGRLFLDGRQVASNSSEFRTFLAVNTNHPLFIGGVPDEVRTRYTVQNGPFHGCLRNFYLTTGEDGQLERALFAQSSIISNVALHTCRV